MKVILTGATGFIGQNLISKISKKKWKTICVARNIDKNLKFFKNTKLNNIKCFQHNIYSKKEDIFKILGKPDVLIHLAWSGLPNYQEEFHIKKNLPNEKKFLSRALRAGVKHIIISGTCFEYGKQEGKLDENKVTKPYTKYGLAKDLLRKYLEKKQINNDFTLQWLRIFYVYGHKQNPNSLFPALKKSIAKKDKYFYVAKGRILRDFIGINLVTNFIVFLCQNKNIHGIINCCSGVPLSIKDFVQIYIKKRKSKIRVKVGNFKKPSYEPLSFWGSQFKMMSSSFKFKNKFF
jgi:nucleoside-diphosphate-sugar epimerase